MLTSKEFQVLNAILDVAIVKCKEDDGDPIYHEIHVNDLAKFTDEQTQSELYPVLAEHGYIQCSGTEDASGNEILEYICITQKGLTAIKSENGVH